MPDACEIHPTNVDVIFLSDGRTSKLQNLTHGAITSLLDSEDARKIRFKPLVIESSAVSATLYGVPTLFPDVAFGYHRFMNIGVRHGNAPFVCLCNNDLVFHPGWATEILRAFTTDASLMSASPYCGFFHRRVLPGDLPTLLVGYENGIHVAGWCLFVRRRIFEVIGAFDERFLFWYCDDDYRMTLQAHSLKHALVTQARVDHLGSVTLEDVSDKNHRVRITSRQALLFQYKWGHKSRLLYLLKHIKHSLRSAFRTHGDA